MDGEGYDDLSDKRKDALAAELCQRLEAAGPRGIGGSRLAQDMHLAGTRSLRRIIAHARVKHHRHEIVGLPGDGYFWGPFDPEKVNRVIAQCARFGRCYFFISSLLKRQGAAMAMVQMVFDFMESRAGGGSREADDLAALVASEGVTPIVVLEQMITRIADTQEGRDALAALGRKHASVLLPRDTIDKVLALLEQTRTALLTGSQTAV